MELQSSLTSSTGEYPKKICTQIYQLKLLKNKGAILVLIWNFLGVIVYQYFTISKERDPIKQKMQLNPEEILTTIGLFLPIGGWLADAYFGRYKIVLFGMWTMWLGAMLNGLSFILGKVVTPHGEHDVQWVALFCKLIMGAGLGVFQANIIQFGVDQLSDASSTEITSFIMWYALTLFASGPTMYYSAYCTSEYVAVLVVAVCLTLALCSNFILNHWLAKEHIISNPLPQIRKVVQYTIRNRYQWPRLFLCEEHGLLSRLNIAKTIYAGPFTSEQVEDVKTFFRVVGVIAIFMIACSGIPVTNTVGSKLAPHLHNWPNSTAIRSCYERLSITYNYTFVLVVVLLYQIIIHPVFYDCIPKVHVTITAKFITAVLLFFTNIVALLGIELASYHYQLRKNATVIKCIFTNTENHGYVDIGIEFYWILIPVVLNGLATFVFILPGIEFICAQAPYNMKGLLFGIGYVLYGCGNLAQSVLSIPFLSKQPAWEKAPLTCGIWYFIIQAVIVVTSFMTVVIMIKKYKRRKRNYDLQSDRQQQT